ncbi:MAG: outer membrane beta-barrel protein, partial [Flammeovirgaceae bacterium]
MKKLLVILFMVVSSSPVFSQMQFSIGIKGGLNFTNLDVSSTSAAYNSRTGYHGGAFVLLKVGKIGVQPELIYSKQGSSFKLNTTSIDANYDYFNIPILLKL